MNYLVRDTISNKTIAFFTNAPLDIVIWIAKKNQDRPDLIGKWAKDQINHELDFVTYHLRGCGYKTTPIRSKIIHKRIDVQSYMSKK